MWGARYLPSTRARAGGAVSTDSSRYPLLRAASPPVMADPLVLADQKTREARALIAKDSFDPAIELLATALELRCTPPFSCPMSFRRLGRSSRCFSYLTKKPVY